MTGNHFPGAAGCNCDICRPHLRGQARLIVTEAAAHCATNESAAPSNVVPFPNRPAQTLSEDEKRVRMAALRAAAGDTQQPLVPGFDGAGLRASYREGVPGMQPRLLCSSPKSGHSVTDWFVRKGP